MKAMYCKKYGGPEVLELKDVPKPVPRDNEILIKNMASAVNSGDVRVRGLDAPFALRLAMRLIFGLTKPRRPVVGMIVSGIVDAVGDKVTEFKPGDKIFGSAGMHYGAHAEYLVLPENAVLAKKPQKASYAEAAAILFGGMTSIYFLRKGGIAEKADANVMIYGATGSVGVAAIELAKFFNARVTAVCGEKGVELAKSLGSDKVLLYTRDEHKKAEEKYDIVYDAVGLTSKKDFAGVLAKNGKYLTVGSMDVAKETREQLHFLCDLFDSGRMQANIDKTYPLDHIVEAHRYVDTGRKKGNVVITIANQEK
jgi:NADPH:quinone reductase-like Zn-dependent oxidoreductase